MARRPFLISLSFISSNVPARRKTHCISCQCGVTFSKMYKQQAGYRPGEVARLAVQKGCMQDTGHTALAANVR